MEVGAWMTRDVETIEPQELLSVADEKMRRRGCRHLAVVDAAGVLLGVLSDHDLREHHGYFDTTKVTGAMVEPPVTVTPETTIEAAGELLLERRIGCLPVLGADEKMIGMVTTTDLLRALLEILRRGGAS